MQLRLLTAAAAAWTAATAGAFATPSKTFGSGSATKAASSSTARAAVFGLDPSMLHDIDAVQSVAMDTFTSLTLSQDGVDAAVSAVSSTDVSSSVDAVADAVVDTVSAAVAPAMNAAADVVNDVADPSTDNGWFGFLTVPIEGLLEIIHSLLVTVGVSANSWGVSIIVLTALIKVVTFPLTKTQLESTSKMQAMQPAIKELQAKYQSNPEVMNQKIAEFYQANEINPLAGCLPSLAQIPIFIGLYRAVLDLAAQNKLDEAFLFLPSLEGPTYGADPTHGSDWILQGWNNGTPSLGWDDTLAFLILPVFLIVSQYVSMELMQPKTQDPAQQQSNAILKVLPIMIGWFSLNVPAALCVYWVINNVITTATSVIIRNSIQAQDVVMSPGGSAAASAPPPPPELEAIFSPPREKPAGFGNVEPPAASSTSDQVKPITAIDVVVEKEQKKPEKVVVEEKKEEPVQVVEAVVDEEEAVTELTSAPNAPKKADTPKQKKRGRRKKKKGKK